ncbi:fimbrial protein [Citrobacter amalonaticus]|uniref:fimbrial protein n=1 Tax=Citrobacter amalonaticus TaxID=35703 RepID=UPI00287A980F|nr:fimbrial protein [Citrobacter amalonaticus]MDS4039440.1 fimbrial protein [Citrobacter amalonaticus]
MRSSSKVLFAILSVISISSAYADKGQGDITFKGSIIDAPCSISFQDANQTVQLGQISKVALINSGSSVARDFSITLEQCDASVLTKKANVKFTGTLASGSTELLAVSTAAGDVGIGLTDEMGNKIAINGTGYNSAPLHVGDNELKFKAMLKTVSGTTGTTPTVNESAFTGVAHFTLDYI